MKGFKLKVDMDLVNTVLLVVILALVVYCLVKQNERFADHEGNNGANVNAAMNNAAGMNSGVGNHVRKLHKMLHSEMNNSGNNGSGPNSPMPTN